MRTLVFFLGLIGVAAASTPDPAITAADLATHLGIHKWTIPAEWYPAHGHVFLRKIEKGHVGDVVTQASFATPGDLVICDHLDGAEDYVTIMCGGTTYSWHGKIAHASQCVTAGIPAEYPAHTYILWADYHREGIRVDTTGKVEDMIGGLAVTILPDEPGKKSFSLPER